MQRDAIPLAPRLVAPPQHRRVIATYLGGPRAHRGRAVKILEDQGVDGLRAVVDARGHDEHAERVLLGRREAELGGGAEEEGPDVERGAGGVGRDEGGVEADGELDALEEARGGHGGDGDEGGGMGHAHGVRAGPEDGDAVVGCAEGFDAFVRLLPVVEAGRHAVNGEVGGGDEFWGRPFAGGFGVVGLNVPLD